MSTAAVPEQLKTRAADNVMMSAPASVSRLSLQANFSWAVAGNAVYAACQWAVLAVLARMASAEVLGEYAFALAVVAPVMIFSMLHLRAIQATDARSEFTFGDFLALRITTTILGMCVIAVIVMTGAQVGASCWLIVLVGMTACADAMSDIFAGALQKRERLDFVAVAMLAKGVLGLLAVVIAVSQGGGAIGAAMALAATRWLVFATYELPTTLRALRQEKNSDWRPRWQWKRLGYLVQTALPLGLVMLLMSLQANVPRYFLKHYSGVESLGIFAGLVALTQLGALVVNALGQAACPRLASAYEAGQRRTFFRLTAGLVLAGGILGAMGVALVIMAGPRILALVYGSQYAAHGPAFLVLMLAAAVLYAAGPLGYAATASRRIRLQPVVHIVNLLVMVSVGWFAAPGGVLGMALVVLVSSLTSVVLFAVILAMPHEIASDRRRLRLAETGAP